MSQVSRTRTALLALTLTALMVLSVIPLQTSVTADPIKKVTWFGEGESQVAMSFNSAGTDTTSAELSLQTGITVSNVSFKIDTQEVSDEYPSNVTIDINGDGRHEWRFDGLGYGALGRQDLFILDDEEQNLTANLTINNVDGENTSAVIRLPYGAQVDDAELELKVKGVTIAIECAAGSRSCDSFGNDPVYSLQSVFEEEGWQVTQVSGGDIDSVGELNDYSLVVLGDSGSNDDDHATFQAALKSWVQDYGGGLLALGWIVYSTPAGSDLDDIMPVSPGYSWSTGAITITNPNHPITQGVNGFNTPVSAHCEYPNSGNADNGATVLGTCGGDTIVYWDTGAGRSVYLGPNYFGNFQSYGSAAWYNDANAVKLLKQAALWASGGGKLTGFLDIGDDGSKEWEDTDFNGTAIIPNLKNTLNTYMATANPTGTDEYGFTYVDIPIKVNSTSAGQISLYNLSIDYTYTATVGPNPVNVSLTNELNGLIPDTIGPNNVTIPIHVTTDTGGRIVLHSFNADISDPDHAPVFTLLDPSKSTQEMDENRTLTFKVAAEDHYRYPVTFQWYLDGVSNVTGDTYDYYADFESMGNHNITVVANNGIMETGKWWTVKVNNVNRPPFIVNYTPELDVTVGENSTTMFSAIADDPDKEPVGYTWKLDGLVVAYGVQEYEYAPDFKDAGDHVIFLTVQDPRQLKVFLQWNVVVEEVNAPPEIFSFTPRTDPTIPENTTANFQVKAQNEDDDTLTYQWFVDDEVAKDSDKRTFNYETDFEDAGIHEVKVEVSDGIDLANHTWKVTVEDVNRAPVAVIKAPSDADEFLTIENITFSAEGSYDPDGDDLTFEWFNGQESLGKGQEVTIRLTKGLRRISVVADDGRDGTDTAEVSIVLKQLGFEVVIDNEAIDPKAGDEIVFKVEIDNSGDGSGEDIEVVFLVDGNALTTRTIDETGPGDIHDLEFKWTAEEGDHVITVKIMDDEGTQEITVGPAPVIKTNLGGSGIPWLLILLILVIIIVVIVAVAAASRRKKKAAEEPPPIPPAAPVAEPATYANYPPSPPPPVAQPYEHTYPPRSPTPAEAVPRPLPPPPPQTYYSQPSSVQPPPPRATATIYTPPAAPTGKDAEVQAAIDKVEGIIMHSGTSGPETRRARNFIRTAKAFQSKGDHEKALQYCNKAEDLLREL